MLAGDAARLTRTLDGLEQEGEAPPLVLWAMTEEIRALAIVKAGQSGNRPLDQLLKDARVWGPRQTPFRRAVQRVDERLISEALVDAGRIDRMIKGIETGETWNEFLRLGLKLCVAQRTGS